MKWFDADIFLFAVKTRPLPHRRYAFPYFIPVPLALPGGRGVNYLSHETEAFGDDLSSRISEQSRDVVNLGDDIQHTTDEQSELVEDIGREVDSDDSMPFPANHLEEDFPDGDDEDENSRKII